MCQLSTPPLVPRQYKPKNLPLPSDRNKNDNDNDNDTLFEFDVTDKDEHGINSFLDVQLLGNFSFLTWNNLIVIIIL